ncbi:hypothetical protein ACROYT_G035378 [Oculina patagonica]
MVTLRTDHPDIYFHFLNGLHVVRRTDEFWDGLSTNLITEETLMRSIKSTGGLSRERGIVELQRLVCNIGLGIKSFHLVTGDGKKTDSTLTPEMTEKTPALETLLCVIRCNCKVDCNIAQSAVTESTDLTVHLPVEGVVEVLVSIHTSSDRSR